MAQAWEDMKRTAQNAYDSIGNTYQQILISGRAYPDASSMNYDIAEGTINPEYTRMQQAYAAQETERERTEGITLDDYPADFDHDEYKQHLAAYHEATRDPTPEDLGMEPER